MTKTQVYAPTYSNMDRHMEGFVINEVLTVHKEGESGYTVTHAQSGHAVRMYIPLHRDAVNLAHFLTSTPEKIEFLRKMSPDDRGKVKTLKSWLTEWNDKS